MKIRELVRKIRLLVILTMVLLIQTLGCNPNSNATLAPFTPTVISLQDVYGVMPSRYENSKNTISVSIEFNGIEFSKQTDKFIDSRRMKLTVHFKNVLANPVVFRKPITCGFLGPDGAGNDLELLLEAKNGFPVTVTSTTNYPNGIEMSTAPKIAIEDFLKIEPGDVFSYSVDVTLPPVYIKEANYADYGGKLPPGKYKLKAEYSNIDIGYRLPLELTPPAKFDNFQAEDEWYANHTMVVDLNAWVGKISSNEVEFTVPTQ